MKICLFVLIFFVFVGLVNAQTTSLKVVENEIAKQEKLLTETNNQLEKLRSEYSEDSTEIQTVKTKILEIQRSLGILYARRNVLTRQTLKTPEGQRLEIINAEIAENESLLVELNSELKALRSKFTDEYAKVKEVKQKIIVVENSLIKLYEERKQLLNKQLTKPLPNNQIELLKIIIQQNQRIIELLENRRN